MLKGRRAVPSRIGLIAACLMALVPMALAEPPAADTATPTLATISLSAHLEAGMTEQEVRSALQAGPTKVEQETCGEMVGHPWPCRVWIFASGTRELMVTFQQDDGEWRVSTWAAY